MTTKNFHIEKYEDNLLDFSQWEHKADCLYEAAKPLKHHLENELERARRGEVFNYHYVAIYYMLSAYAIENLLKGLIVKKQYDEILGTFNRKEKLPSMLDSHDLVALVKTAGMKQIFSEDMDLLTKLGENAVWQGRYPLPMKPDDYKKTINFYTNSDCEWIERIIKEIKNKLKKGLITTQ